MPDREGWVNGRSAGPVHQGGFCAFPHDLSDLVEIRSESLLEVTGSKSSADDSVNAAARRGDCWVSGGRYRPVLFAAALAQSLQRGAVDARADGHLCVRARPDGVVEPGRASVTARDEDLAPGGEPLTAPVVPGDEAVVLAGGPGVEPWTAETPRRYRVACASRSIRGSSTRCASTSGFAPSRCAPVAPGGGGSSSSSSPRTGARPIRSASRPWTLPGEVVSRVSVMARSAAETSEALIDRASAEAAHVTSADGGEDIVVEAGERAFTCSRTTARLTGVRCAGAAIASAGGPVVPSETAAELGPGGQPHLVEGTCGGGSTPSSGKPATSRGADRAAGGGDGAARPRAGARPRLWRGGSGAMSPSGRLAPPFEVARVRTRRAGVRPGRLGHGSQCNVTVDARLAPVARVL